MSSKRLEIGDESYEIVYDDNYGEQLGQRFEPSLTAVLQALLPPGTAAVDVGANIGLTTLLLSQRAATVHAFEIVPTTFALLERNVRDRHGVQLHKIGLGSEARRVSVGYAPDNRSGAFVERGPEVSGHVRETAEIRRLDDVPLGDERVGLIKIDVEGFELEVLRGAPELLQRHQPVVVLEMNHWCLNVLQSIPLPEFLRGLRELFPVLVALDESTLTTRDLHDEDEAYQVMYRHVLKFEYALVVGAFDPAVLQALEDLHASVLPAAEAPPAPPEPTVVDVPQEDSPVAGALARAEVAEKELERLRQSLSWRLTDPLRRARAAAAVLRKG